MVNFAKVEVVNRLRQHLAHDTVANYTIKYDQTWIFDRVHHLLNQFCSAHSLREVYIEKFDTLDEALAEDLQQDCNLWAPGIEIIAVRVTKPVIPDQIRANYERQESEKTKLLIATEAQKVVEKEAETERKKATILAQKSADVSTINSKRLITEKEAEKTIAEIEDRMHQAREKAIADADAYKALKEAEANAKRLTPEYLELQHILAMANNSKTYFGTKIPSMYVDRSPRLGAGGDPEGQGSE